MTTASIIWTSARANARTSRRAFTLIEILLAAGISALLFVAIAGMFGQTMRLRDRAQTSARDAVSLRRCRNLLARDLAGMMVPGDGLGGQLVGTYGTENDLRRDELEWTTTVNGVRAADFGADVVRVSYSLVEDEETDGQALNLVRSVSRNLLALQEEEPEEYPLLSHVSSLSFSYYDGEEWLDSWDTDLQSGQLPLAVKASIENEGINGEALRLDMVVPTGVQAWADENQGGSGEARK